MSKYFTSPSPIRKFIRLQRGGKRNYRIKCLKFGVPRVLKVFLTLAHSKYSRHFLIESNFKLK